MLKRWQFWLGLIISALFLYWTLNSLQLNRLGEELKGAQYWWLVPGVLVYFVAVWARTWRLHYLLRPLQVIPLRRLFPVVCIGYMGNNVYPARAGEFIRAYVLKRKDGVSISASLAMVVVERIFDGVVMLLFVFLALPFTPMVDWLRNIVVVFSLFFFGALLVFFLVAAKPEIARQVYGWIIDHVIPTRFRDPLRGFLDRFVDGLASLRSGRDVAMVFATSLVIWLTETVKYWFVMHGFGFTVPFYVLMLMNGVVNLATTIPSAPGYIGTFDAPGIEILKTFGVPGEIAAGYTFVLHAALWFPITALGGYYMWRESVSWKDFAEASRMKDAQIEETGTAQS